MISLHGSQIATIGVIAWMVYAGFIRRPGLPTSWPMFTRSSAILVDLAVRADGEVTPINAYAHLPSHAPWLTPREFDLLLEYLSQRGVIEGEGTFFGNQHIYAISIQNSRVVI